MPIMTETPPTELTPATIRDEVSRKRAQVEQLKKAMQADAYDAANGVTSAIDARANLSVQLTELESEIYLLEQARPAAVERQRARLERDKAKLFDTLRVAFDVAEADVNQRVQYAQALADVRIGDLEQLRVASRSLNALASTLHAATGDPRYAKARERDCFGELERRWRERDEQNRRLFNRVRLQHVDAPTLHAELVSKLSTVTTNLTKLKG